MKKKNQQKVKNKLRTEKKKFKKMKNKVDDVFDCAILFFNGCNICNIVPVKMKKKVKKRIKRGNFILCNFKSQANKRYICRNKTDLFLPYSKAKHDEEQERLLFNKRMNKK